MPSLYFEPKYVYGLVDPRNGNVRYVGGSENPIKRFRQHLDGVGPPTREMQQWLDELDRDGLRPDLRLFTTTARKDWAEIERETQNHYGATLLDKHGRGRAIHRSYSQGEIGAALRNAREEAGLTPTAAAEKMFTTPVTISRWEGGSRSPSIVNLMRLANAYETTVADMLPTEGGGDGKNSRGAKEDLAEARKGRRGGN